MEEKQKSKPTLRTRANKIKEFRCKNLIAVIENHDNIKNKRSGIIILIIYVKLLILLFRGIVIYSY